MSREQRPSVIYAKVDKQRSRAEQQQPKSRYDTRNDAYRLYQHGRQQSREQDPYNSHYVYDNRHEAGYRKPIAYQDHHNSHLVYDKRQPAGHHAAHDHYNPQYRYSSGQQARYDDSRYKNGPRQEYKYAEPRQDQRYISDKRKYQVQPLYRHDADRGPPGAPHPHHAHPSYYKDYSQNPLQELFTPPEGHQSVHAADVHADPSGEPPQQPDPPQPPEPPVDEKEEEKKRWKPRKIREYRIFKKNRKDDSSDSESSSDEEEAARSGKKEKKKHGRKERKEQTSSEEHRETMETYIKLGDISYVRARSYNKKGVDDLMKAFEAFGFVVIGILYKGGDTVLKIIAPIAAIKAYTALLTPALQGLVAGVTGGMTKGLGR